VLRTDGNGAVHILTPGVIWNFLVLCPAPEGSSVSASARATELEARQE
jgi:hypothetical protein